MSRPAHHADARRARTRNAHDEETRASTPPAFGSEPYDPATAVTLPPSVRSAIAHRHSAWADRSDVARAYQVLVSWADLARDPVDLASWAYTAAEHSAQMGWLLGPIADFLAVLVLRPKLVETMASHIMGAKWDNQAASAAALPRAMQARNRGSYRVDPVAGPVLTALCPTPTRQTAPVAETRFRDPQADLRHRLIIDPDARVDLGRSRGGQVRGEYIVKLRCPYCDRRSAYFLIDPARDSWARCNHRTSCGWYGPLWQVGQG